MRLSLTWITALAYMALIWALSARPHQVDLHLIPFQDKGAHLIEYTLLGLLLARAVRRSWPRLGGLRVYLVSALPAAAFGYIDELHQAFVPNRVSSLGDALADCIGAVLGVSAFLLLERLGGKPPQRDQSHCGAAQPSSSEPSGQSSSKSQR